ncbi:hypothetical protein L7F22_013142 [Adiantum nelumboides]|nr:hypothetical protein [Adiantum nelumboides]
MGFGGCKMSLKSVVGLVILCEVALVLLATLAAGGGAASTPSYKLELVRKEVAQDNTSMIRAWQRSNRRAAAIRATIRRSPAAAYPAVDRLRLTPAPAPAIEAPAGLGGPASEDFVIQLAMGTPAVSFLGIVDTGSDLVWRQCQPCSACFPQPPPVFEPSSSQSYRPVSCSSPLCAALPKHTSSCDVDTQTCTYSYGYYDGAKTSGDLVLDTLSLPDETGNLQLATSKFAFGCGHSQHSGIPGEFSVGLGGIVGLGKGDISLPSQLGVKQFSYCINSMFHVKTGDKQLSSGSLVLGASEILHAAVEYAGAVSISTSLINVHDSPSLYYVNVTGISVRKELLDLPAGVFAVQSDGSGGVIVDSGTSLTIFPLLVYQQLEQAMKAYLLIPAVSYSEFSVCYNSSAFAVELQNIPSLTFHLEGGDLVVPGENFFVTNMGVAGDLTCLAVAGLDINFSILGNLQQRNFLVTYDNSAATLTFAGPLSCP